MTIEFEITQNRSFLSHFWDTREMIWGHDYEEDWDELSPEQQEEIHSRLEKNLYKGVDLGDPACAYALATYKTYGSMGFEKDVEEGIEDEVKYWAEEWEKMQKEKTEIVPTVLVIHPSGYTEFVPADVSTMSFSEMGGLIDAKGVDAVHFSDPLTQITKKCGLKKNVAMYVDKEAVMKNLEDNAVATMLYGRGYEIRGAVIIAMEDDKYDTYSFEIEEDIEAVFEAIDDMTGLLRRETDDDGRYDPWA